MEEIIYPDIFALQISLSDFCSRHFVDIFAQERGIFIANATQKDLGEFLSGLFFDSSDLSEIHDAALHIYRKNSLSGFWASTEEAGVSLIDELEAHSGMVVEPKNKMTLGPIIQKNGLGEKFYIGSIGYYQRQPGRVEFLSEVKRNFDFYLREIEENRWEVLVDGNRSQDVQILEDWFPNFSKRNYQVVKIDQDYLLDNQTIVFFDELSKCGMTNEWLFTQVRKITLRRNSAQNDEVEEKEETDRSILSGISQAMLEGQDLRHNSFVKQCENGGYRFTAMTYEYHHNTHPFVIELRAEFKGRPKLFEVAMEKILKRTGKDEVLENYQFPKEQELQLLTDFYGQAKIIFDLLVS